MIGPFDQGTNEERGHEKCPKNKRYDGTLDRHGLRAMDSHHDVHVNRTIVGIVL